MAGNRDVVSIEHRTGDPETIDIAAAGTESGEFGMSSGCIAAIYYAAPGVNTHLKAQSKPDTTGTFRDVKKPDGTDWTYPEDATALDAAGCIGANSMADFVGLGIVKLVAQTAQTGGWPMQSVVTG